MTAPPFSRRAAVTAGIAAFALPLAGCAAPEVPTAARPTRRTNPSPSPPPGMILGEGPLWSARDNALYWVDIRGKQLHRLSFADNSSTAGTCPTSSRGSSSGAQVVSWWRSCAPSMS
ncbi:MAG: SMP-30/gluconolactonase/LRE family protein [Asticcacaulis sp.]